MPNIILMASVNGWSNRLITANKAEQQAFKRLYDRESSPSLRERPLDGTYRQFRRRILYDSMNGCYRYMAGSIYIGIESDGYTHT